MLFDIVVSQAIQHKKSLNSDKLQFVPPFYKLRFGADDTACFCIFFDEVNADFPAGKTIDQVKMNDCGFSCRNNFIHDICDGTDIAVEYVDNFAGCCFACLQKRIIVDRCNDRAAFHAFIK